MDKAEALAVLRELFAVCPEIGQAVFVSVDPDSKGFCKIRLRMNLDSELKDCIKKVLGARKLELIETKDLAVIYRPKS